MNTMVFCLINIPPVDSILHTKIPIYCKYFVNIILQKDEYLFFLLPYFKLKKVIFCSLFGPKIHRKGPFLVTFCVLFWSNDHLSHLLISQISSLSNLLPGFCIWNMNFSLYFFHKRLHFVIYISNTFWCSKSLTLKHLS